MFDSKMMTDFLASFEINMWWFFLKLFISTIFLLALKNKASEIVDYYVFRSNKYICIGSTVIVDGFEGTVIKIEMDEIIVQNNEKMYIIPMCEARKNRWIVLNKK